LTSLHSQAENIDEATENAEETLALYVEGLREGGRPARALFGTGSPLHVRSVLGQASHAAA
jgi:predicted RNase H-like HicB family nuclease